MRIFVAGASGAIGTRLVARLVDRGHAIAVAHLERTKDPVKHGPRDDGTAA